MTNASTSLSFRGFQLVTILEKPHGHLELILKILDLENEIAAMRGQQSEAIEAWPILYDKAIEIEEFCDDQGRLECNPLSESVWLESLREKIGLDVRAILDPLPEELGLHLLRVIFIHKLEVIQGTIKVCIIRADD